MLLCARLHNCHPSWDLGAAMGPSQSPQLPGEHRVAVAPHSMTPPVTSHIRSLGMSHPQVLDITHRFGEWTHLQSRPSPAVLCLTLGARCPRPLGAGRRETGQCCFAGEAPGAGEQAALILGHVDNCHEGSTDGSQTESQGVWRSCPVLPGGPSNSDVGNSRPGHRDPASCPPCGSAVPSGPVPSEPRCLH